ncbi:MAG TPA: 50S ribosomal protein L11 methyltransferase [Methylovirgula sp.]|nr:50S ribosomal protein L11 methyltransferase [Methylovirgula sp.]
MDLPLHTDVPPRVLQLVQTHFPVLPVPFVPEIRLHKAVPTSGLWRLAEIDETGFGAPYWAHHWGGGTALARYIFDHPDIVAGRRVLDLGSGSGIVGIAAAKTGARDVICADTDKYAVAVARLNAAINEVAVSTVVGDVTADAPPEVDAVLIGDLFYEQDLAARVTAFADRCLTAHIEVVVGDPWRAFLPRSRLQVLAEYAVPDFGDGDGKSAVFRFKPG